MSDVGAGNVNAGDEFELQSALSALLQQQGCSFGVCRYQWCCHDAGS